MRGPGYRNVDLALMPPRAAAARHARSSCAREVFNLLNTPPLGAPNAHRRVGGEFGTITTAGDPRVVQLAVKFLF